MLKPFVEAFGDLAVTKLTHFQVDEFILKQRKPRKVGRFTRRWSKDGTVAAFFRAANAVFNWAVKKQLIVRNPLMGMEVPQARSASRDCLISPEEHQKLLKLVRGRALRNLII